MPEIKSITPEMRERLRAPLPEGSVSQHPTKKFLSSIKPIYVVERLNDVFGVGKWGIKTSDNIIVDGKMVVGKSFLSIPEYGIEMEAFGGNDNADLGDAYKGMVTDALTKMTSYLEIGIDVFKGLADKPGATDDKAKPSNKYRKNSAPTDAPPADESESTQEEAPVKWLNPDNKNWGTIVNKLVGGMKIEEVEKFFKISAENKKKLLNDVKDAKGNSK